jgi:hypothetical protein
LGKTDFRATVGFLKLNRHCLYVSKAALAF